MLWYKLNVQCLVLCDIYEKNEVSMYVKNPFVKMPPFGSMQLTTFLMSSLELSERRERAWREKCYWARNFADYFPDDFRKINPSYWGLVDWKDEFETSWGEEEC